MPWVMWVMEYQSAICWEVSGPLVSLTQSLRVPDLLKGVRPMASSIRAAVRMMAMPIRSQALKGIVAVGTIAGSFSAAFFRGALQQGLDARVRPAHFRVLHERVPCDPPP